MLRKYQFVLLTVWLFVNITYIFEFNWEQITELESVVEKEREAMKVGGATHLRESEIGNENKTVSLRENSKKKWRDKGEEGHRICGV